MALARPRYTIACLRTTKIWPQNCTLAHGADVSVQANSSIDLAWLDHQRSIRVSPRITHSRRTMPGGIERESCSVTHFIGFPMTPVCVLWEDPPMNPDELRAMDSNVVTDFLGGVAAFYRGLHRNTGPPMTIAATLPGNNGLVPPSQSRLPLTAHDMLACGVTARRGSGPIKMPPRLTPPPTSSAPAGAGTRRSAPVHRHARAGKGRRME